MATYIIGGALAVVVGLVVRRMILDRKEHRGSRSCGGDCGRCSGCR